MERVMVGTRKGLFELRPGVSGWQVARASFLGDPVTMVLGDPRDGRWYAALEHGHFGPKLHASDDDGVTWQEVGTPAFPEVTGEDAPSVRTIWSLETGAGDGVLWCGTIPGGLFRSEDRGATWSLVRSLWDLPQRAGWFGGGADEPGIHSILVDPRDARRVRVAVSCGGVWETRDDGATWTLRAKGMRADFMPPERRDDENIQDPHRVVQCRAEPDVLWCQHHCGIFRSVDDGATWQAVHATPSSFGFAVAVHPHDPDTAWFVPAVSDQHRIPVDGRVVVTRTRDGGVSFEALRDGLPQTHAYDLVYRHALEVDASGAGLAFGSTTGSVWVSEDAGDHWAAVSTHLPPVYVVRVV